VKRSLKILLAIVGAVAALLLIVALALPYVVNAERLRPQAEAKLQGVLGRHVSLGKLALSLWGGLSLRAATLSIGEPLGNPAPGAILVDAGETALRVAWLPLLRRQVEVRSVTVDRIIVTQGGKPLAFGVHLASRVRVGADGTVAAEGAAEGRLSAMTAAPNAKADFTAEFKAGAFTISALDLTVGPMRVKAAGKVTDVTSKAPRLSLTGSAGLKKSQADGKLDVLFAAMPEATFEMTASLLDGDEIMAAVAAFAGNAPRPRAGSSLVPAAEAAETAATGSPSFVRLLAAKGTVKAARCVAHGLEMTGLTLRVSMARGTADVTDIKFDAYGGRARGTVTLRPFEPRLPFSLEETAEGIAIGPLIAALAPTQKGTVEGKARLSVRLAGEAGGAAMLPTMNGAGKLAIEDGKIASVGVIKQVMGVLEVAGAKGFAKDETPFDHLSATFNLAAGTAATNDLEFRSADLDGDGGGTIGLGGAVKIDLLASFAKTISDQLVAKTHALSIRQGPDGRLSVPLQIRGTIQEPRIQLDLQKVIKEGALKQLKEQGTKSLLKRILGR
jgi:uncharacterized protein involved in outer membrane biogenesis